MNTRTRRQLLTVLGGLAGGLAGCAGESVESSRTVSETNRATVPDDNAVVDPPMLRRRSTASQPPIRLQDDEGPPDDESSHRLERNSNEVIDTAAKATRLVSTDTEGGDDGDVAGNDTGDDSELSAFIAATDFEPKRCISIRTRSSSVTSSRCVTSRGRTARFARPTAAASVRTTSSVRPTGRSPNLASFACRSSSKRTRSTVAARAS
ncbi:MAG: hypothetical protein A07HN63_02100, partial [uncultured archaeon A07HN63]